MSFLTTYILLPLIEWLLQIGAKDLIEAWKKDQALNHIKDNNAKQISNLENSKTTQDQQSATDDMARHLGSS